MDNVPIEYVVDVLSIMFEGCIKKLKHADSELWSGCAEAYRAHMFSVSMAVFLPPEPDTAYVFAVKRDRSGQWKLWPRECWHVEYKLARLEFLLIHGIKKARKEWTGEKVTDIRMELNDLKPGDLGWNLVKGVHPGFFFVKLENLAISHQELFFPYYKLICRRGIVQKVEFLNFTFNNIFAIPLYMYTNTLLEITALAPGVHVSERDVAAFLVFARRQQTTNRKCLLITTKFADRDLLRAVACLHVSTGCPHHDCAICEDDFDVDNCSMEAVTFGVVFS